MTADPVSPVSAGRWRVGGRGLLKLGVTLALLAWLLGRDDVREGLATIRLASPAWLAGAAACAVAALGLAAWRWWWCLQASGCALPFGTTLRLSLAGQAAGVFSIGAVGADAVRLALGARALPGHGSSLLASVALDHVAAAPAFATCAIAAIGVAGRPVAVAPDAPGAIAAGLALAIGAVLAVRQWRPAWHARVVAVARPLVAAPATRRAALLSLPVLLAHFGIFWCAAQALAVPAPRGGLFAAIMLGDVVASLPVSIAGLGVRETTVEVVLAEWYAVPSALSIAASLVGFLVMAAISIGGALWLPTPRPTTAVRA